MLPASLAACVPLFIATPTSAWASAGASLVPSPVIATSRPAACSSRISSSFSSGVASREEVVHAGFRRDGGGRDGVVARNHHRADPHRAEVAEPLPDAALHHILEMDGAQDAGAALVALGHDQRRTALAPIESASWVSSRGMAPPFVDPARDRVQRPFRIWRRPKFTPLIRVAAAKGMKVGGGSPLPAAVRLADRSAPWRAQRCCVLPGSRPKATRAAPVGQVLDCDA